MFSLTVMKGKPPSTSRDVLVFTSTSCNYWDCSPLWLHDSTEEALLDWVGVFGWLGVCWSLAPSGCGSIVADAVADAVGTGRPGVLGASLSEEQTLNLCVVYMNSNVTWGRRLWRCTISRRQVNVYTWNGWSCR